MKIIYSDRSKRRMQTRYIHPKDRRSAQILAVIQSRRLSLHPLDLLHALIFKLVGDIPWIIRQLFRAGKWSGLLRIQFMARPERRKNYQSIIFVTKII